jgi:hypothetical protein
MYKDGISFKYDDYLPDIGNHGSDMTFATPIIYRDADMVWHVAFQKITYPNPTNRQNFLLYEKENKVLIDKIIFDPHYKNIRNKREVNVTRHLNYQNFRVNILNIALGNNTNEKFNVDKEESNIFNVVATSGTSNLQFWPVQLLKKLETLTSSVLAELVCYLEKIDILNLAIIRIQFTELDTNSIGHSIQTQLSLNTDQSIISNSKSPGFNPEYQSFAIDAPNDVMNDEQSIWQDVVFMNFSIPTRYSSHALMQENSKNFKNADSSKKVSRERFEFKDMPSEVPKNEYWINKLAKHALSIFTGFYWQLPATSTPKSTKNCQNSNLGSDSGPTTPHSLHTVGEYTAYHLQGGLLLADLVIRKMTGERYQNSLIPINPLDEIELKLQNSIEQWEGSSNDNEMT